MSNGDYDFSRFPGTSWDDEDDFEPTESDLRVIEKGDEDYGVAWYTDPADIDWSDYDEDEVWNDLYYEDGDE